MRKFSEKKNIAEKIGTNPLFSITLPKIVLCVR